MLNSIKIFLLAILIVSCEQEPFETEVQNNNDVVIVAHRHYIDYSIIYYGYKLIDEDNVTAEEKIANAYELYVTTYGEPPEDCEQFISWLTYYNGVNIPSNMNSNADFYIIVPPERAGSYITPCEIISGVETMWYNHNLDLSLTIGDDVFIY